MAILFGKDFDDVWPKIASIYLCLALGIALSWKLQLKSVSCGWLVILVTLASLLSLINNKQKHNQ